MVESSESHWRTPSRSEQEDMAEEPALQQQSKQGVAEALQSRTMERKELRKEPRSLAGPVTRSYRATILPGVLIVLGAPAPPPDRRPRRGRPSPSPPPLRNYRLSPIQAIILFLARFYFATAASRTTRRTS